MLVPYGSSAASPRPVSPSGATLQEVVLPQQKADTRLRHILKTLDVCSFRYALNDRSSGVVADPNERNDQGKTVLEQALNMIETLVTRSVCTSHAVEKDGSREQATLRQLRALVQIVKLLVQDPRTEPPAGHFMHEFPPPYFFFAVLKTICEDYGRDEPVDASDILAVQKLVSDIMSNHGSQHYQHVSFLAAFPKCVRQTIDLIGRERFSPDPVTAQRFMHMSLVFNEMDLFKVCTMTPNLYKVGNFCNWEEAMFTLQQGDKGRDFYFALLASKLRERVRDDFVTQPAGRPPSNFDVPRLHVSHSLLNGSRDVFGDSVANCAILLRQQYLRPIPRETDLKIARAGFAEDAADSQWSEVCTALRRRA